MYYILHIYIYTRCLIYYTGTCSDGMCSEMSKLYIIVLFYVVYIYIYLDKYIYGCVWKWGLHQINCKLNKEINHEQVSSVVSYVKAQAWLLFVSLFIIPYLELFEQLHIYIYIYVHMYIYIYKLHMD